MNENDRTLVRVNPGYFAYYVSRGKYQRPRHIRFLERKLRHVALGQIRRLIVNMPPRHGKSELISRYFPAWYLGSYPDNRVILTTYADAFAQTWGRQVRNLLLEHGPTVFPVNVAQDSAAVDRWDIAGHRGGMVAAGIGGQITGKGANVLIIDDPVKDAQEAHSPTIQQRNLDWFRSVASPRLEPGGAIVILMTRWHVNDLAGMLTNPQISADADTWEVVNLPALAVEGDPLGREPGAALWPERFDVDALQEIRAGGARWFETQYQQNPTVESEAALWRRQWIKYVPESQRDEILKNAQRIVVGIDPAVTSTEHSDENGIIVCARGADNNAYVISDRSMRGSPLAWATRAIAAYDECGADRIIAETNQGGDMVLHTLRTVRHDVAVDGVTAHRGKALRADPIASLYEQGRVFHVGSFPELEAQMLSWVPGEGDSPDRIDALVHALTYLFPQKPESKVWVL